MTLMEAAKKWNLSPNWVRELIKSGRVPAKLRDDVPVPYYEIPEGTPKPPSMQRGPGRKGSNDPNVKLASKQKRVYRAAARARAQKD